MTSALSFRCLDSCAGENGYGHQPMPPTGQLARVLTVRFLETGFCTVAVEAFSERAFIVPPYYFCSTTECGNDARCKEVILRCSPGIVEARMSAKEFNLPPATEWGV